MKMLLIRVHCFQETRAPKGAGGGEARSVGIHYSPPDLLISFLLSLFTSHLILLSPPARTFAINSADALGASYSFNN